MELASVIAVQRFDLDDLGSQVRQHHRGDRAELPHGPINHPQTFQGAVLACGLFVHYALLESGLESE